MDITGLTITDYSAKDWDKYLATMKDEGGLYTSSEHIIGIYRKYFALYTFILR
jgi:hypothetical protein